jgi:hypothetical protein
MKQTSVWKEGGVVIKVLKKLFSAAFERPSSVVFTNINDQRNRSIEIGL